jgi:hypothetical protein
MAGRRENLGRQVSKKFKREGKGIARGVAREGKKIVTGAVKGFLNAFNPFGNRREGKQEMSIIVDDCIRRIEAEIVRTQAFPDSAGKSKRLAELKAMLQEYEQAETAGNGRGVK